MKETPAEQLLRMIEGTQGAADIPKPPPRFSIRGFYDTARDFWTRLWQRFVPKRWKADSVLWNLQLAQWLLWVGLAGLFIYCLVGLTMTPARIKLGLTPQPETTATPTDIPVSHRVQPSKSLGDYLAIFAARNPFTGQTTGGMDKPAVKSAQDHLAELASGLVVVGIDRGPTPIALIENTAQQRTYVVKVGDDIKGMQVVKIGVEGVVVSYEGEELVLP